MREQILQQKVEHLELQVEYWKNLADEREEMIEQMRKNTHALALMNLETKQQNIRLRGK